MSLNVCHFPMWAKVAKSTLLLRQFAKTWSSINDALLNRNFHTFEFVTWKIRTNSLHICEKFVGTNRWLKRGARPFHKTDLWHIWRICIFENYDSAKHCSCKLKNHIWCVQTIFTSYQLFFHLIKSFLIADRQKTMIHTVVCQL